MPTLSPSVLDVPKEDGRLWVIGFSVAARGYSAFTSSSMRRCLRSDERALRRERAEVWGPDGCRHPQVEFFLDPTAVDILKFEFLLNPEVLDIPKLSSFWTQRLSTSS